MAEDSEETQEESSSDEESLIEASEFDKAECAAEEAVENLLKSSSSKKLLPIGDAKRFDLTTSRRANKVSDKTRAKLQQTLSIS